VASLKTQLSRTTTG